MGLMPAERRRSNPAGHALKQAAIFDMDGVLVDSEPLWKRADRQLVEAYGGTGDVRAIEIQIMGTRERESVAIMKEHFGLSGGIDELIEARRRFLLDIYEKELKPRKGLLKLLERLQTAGVRRAVASSTSHEIIEWVLQRIGARQMFQEIVSGVDVEHGKPAPDIFFRAAERLDVPPRFCIVLEDAPNGVKAAKAAGMYCIGILHSFNSPELLRDADILVKELTEVSSTLFAELFGTKKQPS